MIAFFEKICFLRLSFLNTFFLIFLYSMDEHSIALESKKQKNFQDSKILYEVIDLSTTNFSNPFFQNGFGLNLEGNILFSDDNENISAQYFQNYRIPKIYFQSIELADIRDISIKYLSVQIPFIVPVINKKIQNLLGECKNSMCVFTPDGMQKKYVQGIGGFNQEEVGLMIIPEIERLDSDLYPIFKYKIVDTDVITTIGGVGEYAAGMRAEGIINTNKLIAIGGIKNGATGFLNEYFLNAGNLIGIGGGGLGADGLDNSSYTSRNAFLKANNIIAVGGTRAYAYGVYNSGKIEANFLTAIGGENLNAIGFYNQKDTQVDVLIALGTQNSGIAILNEGQIDVKLLVVIANDGYYSLRNDKGKINAESIYIRGKNAISSSDNGLIATNNLFISDFSSIQGSIVFNTSKTSLMFFDVRGQKWNNDFPFFNIKDGNLILNSDTRIEAKFSNEWILGNNLSYDTIYHLLSMTGKGELIDNRIHKDINFLGLSISPQIKTDKTGIIFAFIKKDSPSLFVPTTETSEIKNKKDSLGENFSQEKIIQKLTFISDHAPSIFRSIIEANNNGMKFQEIAIDEGVKNFESNPKLLISLIEKTDKMLKNSSISVANFSQKTTQYVNQKSIDRINNLIFKRNFRTPKFVDIIHKYTLASNDEQIYMPEFSTENSIWVNIGGSYYNSSVSLNSFSITSVNSSMGYDREIDIGKNIDFILGGLFNYGKSFYYQNNERQNFDTFTSGIYSNMIIDRHEIQSSVSMTQLLGNNKIHNEEIGIFEESYANNNFSLNIEAFYKYNFTLSHKHSIKPLVLTNYSFLYTPSSTSKTFFSKNSYDQVFALGTGGEYHFENSFMKHIFQFTSRYHIKDITKTRSISFKGAQTFINYDLIPSRMWIKISYGGKFVLPSNFDLDFSISADMSTLGDFLGMGNLGMSYVW
ncbi:autotransporter outer membrane beta-barrel domain-containing protein [Helicobacter cappadocius]|uniref:Autotransporter outer membrane beta-barrel domain-containing protein n=1 Tax=Helicobacter cappadocius TaxID=3063998 RepID=A0AA90PSQ1_9HELI|nr:MULTISPECIES: autotransporter outer membrane beta-barrel domain-containing protein [unclassified Helicobacter]MDO7253530.1 autotransporter outer membrane beta-barrel domain-containing protein [Helicobacter sp. faydin-H75]MDP2539457.1 autotransporter outer membrane beta-barrel domain-containing protein [Helicobacter sp. faydin-H76]